MSSISNNVLADCYFALEPWNTQNGGPTAILLIASDLIEPLNNIITPRVLTSKSLGDIIKKALSNGEMVNINVYWPETLPHPAEKVEYEFWTNINDECGPQCDSQIDFFKNFKGAAQILEQKGYTQFTPHYMTWYCPRNFTSSI